MTQALTLTLSDFLLARIAEREATAKAASVRNGAVWQTMDLQHSGWRVSGTVSPGNPHSYGDDGELWDDEGAMGMYAETAAHIALNDPAFVLAECAAHRRVIENELGDISEGSKPRRVDARRRLYLLALPYADHPDFRSEWAL